MLARTELEPSSDVIHPDDNMYNSDSKWYFFAGRAAAEQVQKMVALSGDTEVRSILDLPSGHGRAARFLRPAYPNAHMTFCDIQQDGAEFCAKIFGGDVLAAENELDKLAFQRKYDVIWMGSLFTHVSLDKTTRWLRHLCNHALEPNGLLIATFHGRHSISIHSVNRFMDDRPWQKVLKGYYTQGYGYIDYTDASGIGTSLSKPSKIVEIVEDIEGIRMLCYQERGWGDNHDVLTIKKRDRVL